MLEVKSCCNGGFFENILIFEKLKEIVCEYGLTFVIDYIKDLELYTNLYLKDGQLIGFSCYDVDDYNPKNIVSEVCWFVIKKNKSTLIEIKWFFDETLREMKSRGVKTIKFNCDQRSWGKVQDVFGLFERFGYNAKEDDFYDISMDI